MSKKNNRNNEPELCWASVECVLRDLDKTTVPNHPLSLSQNQWQRKKEKYLYEGLTLFLMRVEAAKRSVQQSHNLWPDPSFVTRNEADPVLSKVELSLDQSSKDDVGVLGRCVRALVNQEPESACQGLIGPCTGINIFITLGSLIHSQYRQPNSDLFTLLPI